MGDQTHIELPPYAELNGDYVYRNQLVIDTTGQFQQAYVVVAVRDGAVQLQDPDFDGPPFWVEEDDWNGYEPRTGIDGVPLWAY